MARRHHQPAGPIPRLLQGAEHLLGTPGWKPPPAGAGQGGVEVLHPQGCVGCPVVGTVGLGAPPDPQLDPGGDFEPGVRLPPNFRSPPARSLCLVTVSRVWGWMDLLLGMGSPHISPFWLLVPCPKSPPHKWLRGCPGRVSQQLAFAPSSAVSSAIVIGAILKQLGSCFCADAARLSRREKHRKRPRRKQNHLLERARSA